ncbi:MAG: hypothetical protein AAFY02_11470 [Pseudomonadota bacterium]
MIPTEQPDEARDIDALATFVYSARRATATVNTELAKHGMETEDVNEWLVLRLLQVEGASALNKLAWELALARPAMMRLAGRMDTDGLIVYTDSPDVGRFKREATITERGVTKLSEYEGKAQEIAVPATEALPKSKMIGFSKAIMALSRKMRKGGK